MHANARGGWRGDFVVKTHDQSQSSGSLRFGHCVVCKPMPQATSASPCCPGRRRVNQEPRARRCEAQTDSLKRGREGWRGGWRGKARRGDETRRDETRRGETR
eukprot:1275829-Rhodomonas_salina.3